MLNINHIKNTLDSIFSELEDISKLTFEELLSKVSFLNKVDYYIISITELNTSATNPLKGPKSKIEPMDFYNKENKQSVVYVFFTENEATEFIQKHSQNPDGFCVDKINFEELYSLINFLYTNNDEKYPVEDVIIRFLLNDDDDIQVTSIDHKILFEIFRTIKQIVPYEIFCAEQNVSNILIVKILQKLPNFKVIFPIIQYVDHQYVLYLNIISNDKNIYPEDLLKVKKQLQKITNNIFSEFYINFNQQALEYASYYNLHEYAVIENVTK